MIAHMQEERKKQNVVKAAKYCFKRNMDIKHFLGGCCANMNAREQGNMIGACDNFSQMNVIKKCRFFKMCIHTYGKYKCLGDI